MQIVNIGILAHVDAGKTSLTERLLFETGAIDRLGSVDAGTTQTDTGDIERRRGITIRSAVAPFSAGDRRVNLIDTPGHSDFIAEVERALGVLDAAVLVLSAVEGVQPHTRVLMKTLRAMRLPVVMFVNKIDRIGARDCALVADIARLLTPYVVPLGEVRQIGTPDAGFVANDGALLPALAEHDEALLADYVAGVTPPADRLCAALQAQIARAQTYPLVFGSALSGAGVPALLDVIQRLLPPAPAPEERLRGKVFAIDRGTGGEKIAYVRAYGGELRVRQRVVAYRQEVDGRTTAVRGQISALDVVGGDAEALTAGHIARVRGLAELRIGDQLGTPDGLAGQPSFARPSLETEVLARRPSEASTLHAALLSLADQDPLIRARVDTTGLSRVLLYGEVQMEVIATTLADVYGVEAVFQPAQLIHLERPIGVGAAVEWIGHGFAATVGLRVEPATRGAGLVFRREVELGALLPAFNKAVEESVAQALEYGLYGWPVTDIVVTLTHCGYWAPITTAGDFRELAPVVLARALALAGTRVSEPCHRFEVEIPPDRVGPVTGCLAQLGARIDESVAGAVWTVVGEIPARTVREFQQRLPGLTSGEGVWSSRPYGDRTVAGTPPVRQRRG